MWPFGRKSESGGFDPARYQINDQEMTSVRSTFEYFATPDGKRIGTMAHPPEVTRGLVVRGLWAFAETETESADFISKTANRSQTDPILNKAIQAIKKAYAIHRLPIYIYDLARYQEKKGLADQAKITYGEFVDAQSRYRPLTYDSIFTYDRNVDEAVQEAQRKLTGAQQPPDRTIEDESARPRATDRHPRAW